MSMIKRFFILFVMSAPILWNPSATLAQANASPQEIMIQLADASGQVIKIPFLQNPQKKDFQITAPDNWKVTLSKGDQMDFKVPYHVGIFGKWEWNIATSDVESSIEQLANDFKTKLTLDSSDVFDTAYLSGTYAILNGRIGGELWKICLFVGKLNATETKADDPDRRRNVRFFALAPQRWFHVYQIFFNDILGSLREGS